MDKKLVELLMNKGYITTHVNADMYKDVDDLFDKGIITFPGSKNAVVELLKTVGVTTLTTETVIEPVDTLDDKDDTNNIEIKKEPETTTEPVAETEEVSVKKTTKKTTKKTE